MTNGWGEFLFSFGRCLRILDCTWTSFLHDSSHEQVNVFHMLVSLGQEKDFLQKRVRFINNEELNK